MIEWRAVSSDPNNREAALRMDAFLRSITRLLPAARIDMILDFCRDQSVLDIGAGEHDPSFYSEEGWEHGRIARVAARAVAVEIDPALCQHYRAKGFDFRCLDATGDADLGERFDRVFIGDVIEHVNDPVALLKFAARHLKPGGRMLVTTPIPFAPRFRRHRRQWGTRYVMANLEHTRWVSISNMHELALRAGLDMTGLLWPMFKKPKRGLARDMAVFARNCLLALAPLEEVFAEYAFELARASGPSDPVRGDAAEAGAAAR